MRHAALLTILLAIAVPATAAPLAKKGDYDTTTCWSGETFVMPHSQSTIVVHYRVTGTSRSNVANKAWDQNTFMCAGVTLVEKNVPTTTAYCEYVDGDGDKTFGRTTVEANVSRWTFLSGTGKYAGITGGGTQEQDGRFPIMRPGQMSGCTRNKGSWTLP
jgi:hypothetical protein